MPWPRPLFASAGSIGRGERASENCPTVLAKPESIEAVLEFARQLGHTTGVGRNRYLWATASVWSYKSSNF